MTAIERLEQLLDERDTQIEELEQKLQDLTDESERAWDWARHSIIQPHPLLPIPRLEIRCVNLGNWYNWEWRYGFVYKHLLGHLVLIPMGNTKCGGSGKPPMDWTGKYMDLPFRDGAHFRSDFEQLNLPAFAIIEGLNDGQDLIHRVYLDEEGMASQEAV